MFQVKSKLFNIFNNTAAEIVKKGDYDDYENAYNSVVVGTVQGDLQPYSGELLEKAFGFYKECQKRFFCEQNENIREGVYLKIDDVYYLVVYKTEWDLGMEVMLKEVLWDD